MSRQDVAWQGEAAVRWFLDSVRGAIPFSATQLAIMLRIVANGRQPVRSFLDVGAGDGLLSAVMLAQYPRAEAVLVDFSAPMLDAARERLAALPAQPVLVETDLASPAWRDAVAVYVPFDAVVSGFAIHHLDDDRKRALYGELGELLAPEGSFAHIEHVAPEAPWIGDAFDEAIVDAIWEHGRRTDPGITRDQSAAAYASRPDRDANRLAPLDVQCEWLREAGFVNVVAPFRWYEIAVFGGYRPA
ncbi:MAG: class I SAM-dependent methyltransferase [Chloroflexia bacterium]|nr:class I SAM-dependent methyltransferase [Chloroflexia bacterium]